MRVGCCLADIVVEYLAVSEMPDPAPNQSPVRPRLSKSMFRKIAQRSMSAVAPMPIATARQKWSNIIEVPQKQATPKS